MNNDRNKKNLRVAIDIGGTFTDAVATTADGTVFTAKSSTTPGNLTDGVIEAIQGLDIDLKQVTSFIHGTTAGLNALLERRGAKVALLTTMGFRDIYEIIKEIHSIFNTICSIICLWNKSSPIWSIPCGILGPNGRTGNRDNVWGLWMGEKNS